MFRAAPPGRREFLGVYPGFRFAASGAIIASSLRERPEVPALPPLAR